MGPERERIATSGFALLAMTAVTFGWSFWLGRVAKREQLCRSLWIVENLYVGVGLLDDPLGNVANLPNVSHDHRMLLPGRRGRRPLRSAIRAFNGQLLLASFLNSFNFIFVVSLIIE